MPYVIVRSVVKIFQDESYGQDPTETYVSYSGNDNDFFKEIASVNQGTFEIDPPSQWFGEYPDMAKIIGRRAVEVLDLLDRCGYRVVSQSSSSIYKPAKIVNRGILSKTEETNEENLFCTTWTLRKD